MMITKYEGLVKMMKNSLEDELNDIIKDSLDLRVDSGQAYINDTDEAIARIKQAFTEYGQSWTMTVTDGSLHKSVDGSDFQKMMTGRDWYDRFLKEYRAISLKAYVKDQYAKMAARRASGLSDE